MRLNNFSLRIIGGSEIPGGYVELEHDKTYSIQLRNDHDVDGDASISIDGNYIGTWRINSKSSVKIERPANEKRKFTFYRLDSKESKKAGLSKSNENVGLISVLFTVEMKQPEINIKPLIEEHHHHYYYPDSIPWIKPWPGRYYPWEPTITYGSSGSGYTSSGSSNVNFAQTDTVENLSGNVQSDNDSEKFENVQNIFCASVSHNAGGTGLSEKSKQEFETVEELTDIDKNLTTVINLRLVEKIKNDEEIIPIRPIIQHSTPIPPKI